MKSYEVTYLVDGLHVKGYLGLPECIDMTESEIAEAVRLATGAESHLPVEPITYEPDYPFEGLPLVKSADGTTFCEKPEQLPALLYCRGGIGRVGLSRLEWIATFCSFGFVVFAPWYRGTLGTEGRDEFGGADKNDGIVGYRILAHLSCVCADDISILGFSRGSINATFVALAEPTAKALILWGGVSDLTATYEERVDLRRMLRRVVGGTPRRVGGEYRARSPIYYADQIHCRTLVIHSTADPQVAFHHGQHMYAALLDAGVPVTWQGYQGYAHHFDPLVREAVINRMLEWTRG